MANDHRAIATYYNLIFLNRPFVNELNTQKKYFSTTNHLLIQTSFNETKHQQIKIKSGKIQTNIFEYCLLFSKIFRKNNHIKTLMYTLPPICASLLVNSIVPS